MSLLSLSFVYLSFYAIAVILAFLRGRAGTAPKARNSMAAMIIGAVGTLLIYFSSLLSPGGTVPLVLVAALALFPVFLLGLGNLVGLGIATWRPQLFVQFGLTALALGVPLLAIITAGLEENAPIAQSPTTQNDTQIEAQRPSIKGRLGRYPISFPTSPQIDTYYTCVQDNGTLGQCQTDFAANGDLGRLPGEVAIFHQITIARKSAECGAPCLTFRQLAQWCQSRSDVTFTEWCRNTPNEEVAFSYDENRVPSDDTALGWRTADANVPTAVVTCHEDKQMCRARYEIARNLQVTIWMPDADTATLSDRIKAAQEYVERLWSEMQSNG